MQAQAFKPADVAAAFADLRDGPKSNSPAAPTVSTPAGGVASKEPAGRSVEIEEIVEDEEEDEAGELFVIGDDASEASEASEVRCHSHGMLWSSFFFCR